MELNKIQELLKRFEEGETTRQEEEVLFEYFQNRNIPAFLKEYGVYFKYVGNQRKISTNKEMKKPGGFKYNYAWTSIAAVIIVALGMFYFNSHRFGSLTNNDLGTISDEELALKRTKETLKMVSQLMNEGKADLVYLKEFNKTARQIIVID